MPPDSTRKSRFAGPSCKSILYCNPEHPPPTTATRKTPWARPCFVSSEPTFRAALGVTLINRSSPTRKLGGVMVLFGVVAIIICFFLVTLSLFLSGVNFPRLCRKHSAGRNTRPHPGPLLRGEGDRFPSRQLPHQSVTSCK